MIAPVFSSRVSVAVEAAAGLAMLTLAKSEGHKMGLPNLDVPKRTPEMQARIDMVARLYLSGLTPRQISDKTGLRYESVWNDIKKAKVTPIDRKKVA